MTDKTLTAQISALGPGDLPTTPLLLLAGRANVAAIPARDRLLVCGPTLQIGRRAAGGAGIEPGALLLDDAVASSRHARLKREGDGFVIEDLGSKNGTFVDGERIDAVTPVRDGSRIFVGGHLFVFRLASAGEIEAIKAELASPLVPVATASPRLADLSRKLRRLAVSPAEIFLVGETGVGKDVYARAVHEASGRKGKFVALNCAAIPRELVESELFGFGSGAHSTAHREKSGLLEAADGGTLFLDEIGEMSPDVQTKLLRFLQDRLVTPLGSTRPRPIDVRVVAATNRDVAAGVSSGVRDDLLGRLGAAPIRILPLRDRLEDVGALACHFLAQASASGCPGFDVGALRALLLMSFPMNVRELEKIVVAAAALAQSGAAIAAADLPESRWQSSSGKDGHSPDGSAPGASNFSPTPSGRQPPQPAPEAQTLERLLTQHQGNVAEVARSLGRQRAAVWRWIKRYGLLPERYRQE